MAINPTYPGVYVSETTSPTHVITPATTSVTAFVGAFPRGATTEAVLVTSWSEFAAEFGGLTTQSSLAVYGVWQFFQNAPVGSSAWIVRMVPTADPPGTTPPTGNVAATPASAVIGPPQAGSPALQISANSPGAWAEGMEVQFVASGPASHPDPYHADLIVYPAPLATGSPLSPASPPAAQQQPLETLQNIPVLARPGDPPLTAAHVAQLITDASNYLSAQVPQATSPPSPEPTSAPLAGGSDGTWATPSALWTAVAEQELTDGGRLTQIAPNVFNLLCLPDLAVAADGDQSEVFTAAHKFCEDRQAFLIVDAPPPTAGAQDTTDTVIQNVGVGLGATRLIDWAQGVLSPEHVAAAVYYPWVQITDPAAAPLSRLVPPSGTIAGVYAATDASRGVWKAPAGTEAALGGVSDLADATITDIVNGQLNVLGINCLRRFPLYGPIVWGSRTLAGSDLAGSPFKYVPVRRLSDYIEQSLQQSLRWAVFEPNGPALWSSISIEVTAFLSGLFGAGAFAGATAAQAYTVACDATTTTALDQQNGIVNVNVQFAPIDPAEFVMLNIQINAASAAS